MTSVTEVGQLMTTFTAPSSCATSFTTDFALGGYEIMGPITANGGCLPPGYNNDAGAFYLPGLCPAGYTEACSVLSSLDTLTVTFATCCPPGFGCASSITANSGVTYGCSSSFGSFVGTYVSMSGTSTIDIVPTTTITSGGGRIAHALGIGVAYRSTDFSGVVTLAVASQSSSASPSSTSTGTIFRPTTTTPSHTSSSDLSKGAIAGIVVGTIAGCVVALCLLRACAPGWWISMWAAVHRCLPGGQESGFHHRPSPGGDDPHLDDEVSPPQYYGGIPMSERHGPAVEWNSR